MRTFSGDGLKSSRGGTNENQRPNGICGRSSKTHRSTRSRSARQTTGIRSVRFGPARPGKMFTSKSLPRTTCGKDERWSKPPGNTTGSFSTACSFEAHRPYRKRSSTCGKGPSVRSIWREDSATDIGPRSGKKPGDLYRKASITICGSGPRPRNHSTRIDSTTTGTTCGISATATSVTRASMKWTCACGGLV